jgi:hypothetical protein
MELLRCCSFNNSERGESARKTKNEIQTVPGKIPRLQTVKPPSDKHKILIPYNCTTDRRLLLSWNRTCLQTDRIDEIQTVPEKIPRLKTVKPPSDKHKILIPTIVPLTEDCCYIGTECVCKPTE